MPKGATHAHRCMQRPRAVHGQKMRMRPILIPESSRLSGNKKTKIIEDQHKRF